MNQLLVGKRLIQKKIKKKSKKRCIFKNFYWNTKMKNSIFICIRRRPKKYNKLKKKYIF